MSKTTKLEHTLTSDGRTKKHLLGALPEVLDKKCVKPDETHAALTDQRDEQIGRLKVELDWLK